MMKLLGSTKSKISKFEYVENVSDLEITEVVVVNCNIFNNDCKQDSRNCIHLLLINQLTNYYVIHLNILYF